MISRHTRTLHLVRKPKKKKHTNKKYRVKVLALFGMCVLNIVDPLLILSVPRTLPLLINGVKAVRAYHQNILLYLLKIEMDRMIISNVTSALDLSVDFFPIAA